MCANVPRQLFPPETRIRWGKSHRLACDGVCGDAKNDSVWRSGGVPVRAWGLPDVALLQSRKKQGFGCFFLKIAFKRSMK